ncbi:MAG TPA: hypothetical protein VH350_17635 [Candidatus Sulfotelmatobacter sp.]|jgi:hypothetical protein|nr:hypothetical protein [Candidatus Sulfotelmatobacter sp.]
MSTLLKKVSALVLVAAFSMACSLPLKAQEKRETALPGNIQELPVIFQQGVTAGKTAVGTKLQAKLSIATLLNGVVFPRNSILSGEVVESAAKTKNEPSRISIRMDSVNSKDKSAPIKLYLTSWYYPSISESGQNLQYGPTEPPQRTWNGAGAYPDPNSHSYKPFPDSSDKGPSVPDTPSSKTSDRRALMKDVDIQRGGDGGIVLVSKHSNLKLDHFTTYVLSAYSPSAK